MAPGPQHDADGARRVRFARGLVGFPDIEQFRIEDVAGAPPGLKILRAQEDRTLGFLVLPCPPEAGLLEPDDVAAVRDALGIDPADLLVLVIVTTLRRPDGLRLYANLRAPLLIDVARREGAQVVLADPGYPLRHPLQCAA
jgi:flagellar assembly factor FliW